MLVSPVLTVVIPRGFSKPSVSVSLRVGMSCFPAVVLPVMLAEVACLLAWASQKELL